MHRAVKVSEYWNWLPAFRAVAETGNLRTAASTIHVAPSAISRTVRLLEDALGYPLFERTSGALVMNAAGRDLLDAVRGAMRMVNDAEGGAGKGDGPCHIHCPSDVVPLLLDALVSWSAVRPGAVPLVHVPCDDDVAAQLLRGDLDVALAFEPATRAGVVSQLLAEVSSSLYAAPSHPVSARRELTDADLGELPFVDYPPGELGFLALMRDRDKQRVAFVPTMALAVRLCASGLGLVCVPDFVASSAGVALTRLPWELPRARLHVWFRRPLIESATPALVSHLKGHPAFASLVAERGDGRSAGPKPKRRRPKA